MTRTCHDRFGGGRRKRPGVRWDLAGGLPYYDALCRVALRHGFGIGDPLPEPALRDAERRLGASDRTLYAHPADATWGRAEP